VQPGGDDGGAGDGVGALVEGTAGVGRLAGDNQMIVAAALARPGQGAIRHRRLIGQADVAARAQFGQQGGGGGRTDLLVGREQDGPADAVALRMGLERLQSRQHHADAALHVGDPGTVQGAVGAGGHGLERTFGREDGVIVAGQHDLDGSVGPGGDLQRVGMGLGPHPAVVADRGGAPRRDARDLDRQAAGLGLEQGQHMRQSAGVTAARIDVGPLHRAADDGGFARRDMVGGQNPHASEP